MARNEQTFLARWSHLKRERDAAARPVAAASTPGGAASAAPALPALDALTPESDFTAFMHPRVADALRCAALKKLFLHPEINVPDPFEPFCDDLTAGEPIPGAMLQALLQAREAVSRPGDPQAEEVQAQARAVRPPDVEPAARVPERMDGAVLEPRGERVLAALDPGIGEGT